MKKEYLEKLCCPACKTNFTLQKNRLICTTCKSSFLVEGNILYILSKKKEKVHWDTLYQNEREVIRNAQFFLAHKESIPVYYNSLSILKKEGKIRDSLEIGCGTGSYSLFLKKLGIAKNVVLVDYSINALKVAQRLFSHFHEDVLLVCADAFSLPFKDKAFDISFSSGLLEHFNKKLQHDLVSEHGRVAKKTLIQVPYDNVVYQSYKKAYILLHGGWPFGFEKPMNKKELKDILLSHGMKIEHVFYHDLLSAALFQLSKKKIVNPQRKKNIFNALFRHEIGMLART